MGARDDDWQELVERAATSDVRVEGIWTHLARADEDVATTDEQLRRFERALAVARDAGLEPRLVHAANSAGALRHPGARYDMVRCGIAVYGLSPAPDVRAADHGLQQALRLVTEVSYAKRVPAGTPISYGHTWSTPSDGWVATIPIGYADGVPRVLSNCIDVIAGGRRRPLVGTVTMDQVMVWYGDDEPEVGAEVVLLGAADGDMISVDEWAERIPTISYEVSCGIGARVPRVHDRTG